MNAPIHVAITRRVKPGCELEFQTSLREFITASFTHNGVHGANMIMPPPGSTSREFGILRSFANTQERDAFHETALFKAWEEKVKALTEGEPEFRQLHGLEAWFRKPQSSPPKWKMAFLTWIAVWPISMILRDTLNPLIGQSVPPAIFGGVVASGMVALLTWVAMPVLVKIARSWLQPQSLPNNKT